MTIARKIKDSHFKINAVAALACHLPKSQRDLVFKQEVFEATRNELKGSNEQDYFAKKVLKTIAPYLSESLLQDALIIADRINNSYFRTETLVSLICHLPQSQQESVLREYILKETILKSNISNSIEVIDLLELKSLFSESMFLKLRDELWSKRALNTWNDLNSANLLNEQKLALDTALLIPYLSDKLEDVLRKTLLIACQTDDNTRKSLLELLGLYLSQLSSVNIFPLWCETLNTLARRSRKDLLSDLSALTPVIESLGGSQEIEEIAYAIQDVGRWWS